MVHSFFFCIGGEFMQFNMPDFLHPLGDDNRDEVILIEFHRVLKNTNMAILRNLYYAIIDNFDLTKVFPNAVTYMKLGLDAKYDTTVLFTGEDFIYNLSGEKLNRDFCSDYVRLLRDPLLIPSLHVTRVESMLREFLKHEFVKKVYIVADKFTNEMEQFMRETFQSLLDSRLFCVEGDIQSALTDLDVTTAFISDSEDVHQIVTKNRDSLKDKMILVMDGYHNVYLDDKKDLQYKYMEEFVKLGEDKIANVGYIYPHCISKGLG